MIRILLIGSKGLLGSYLLENLVDKRFEIIPVSRPEYNICSYRSMEKLFLDKKITYVINCAAYTNVDKAEDEKKEAFSVNCVGVGVLSKLCFKYGSHLIHFSTDYVFNGEKDFPYWEDEKTDPISYYGFTKLRGEEIIIKNLSAKRQFTIFRLQWLYGYKKGFFKWLLAAAKEKDSVNVFYQVGAPCSVTFVYKILYRCFYKNNLSFDKFKGEVFHLTHDDYCKRFDCAKYFLDKFNLGHKLKEVSLESVNLKAKRPVLAALNNDKIRNFLCEKKPWHWSDDLDNYIEEIKCQAKIKGK